MKHTLVLFLICVMPFGVFGQEEPRLHIGVGLECEFQTGYYDADGTVKEADSLLNTYSLPLTLYYEIITGLELGLKAGFKLETLENDVPYGPDQVAVSVKYTFDFGLGAYVDMYLPIGSEEIVGTTPELYFNFALFYYTEWEGFFVSSEAVYMLTFAGDDKTTYDNFKITAQPGYVLSDLFQVTLGLEFDYFLNQVFDGEVVSDSSNYVFKVSPGVSYEILEFLSLSLEVPVTVFGASSARKESNIPVAVQNSSWGITVTATFNLL
jgi:hypothetical protein